jgi:hypothetical protein
MPGRSVHLCHSMAAVGSPTVEYGEELHGERERRKEQDEALATGRVQPTDQLDRDVRVKLNKVWDDVRRHSALHNAPLEELIGDRTLESIAVALDPSDMLPRSGNSTTNRQLLSLVEAEHEALRLLTANPHIGRPLYPGLSADWLAVINAAPENFRTRVNRILKAHIVSLSLHENSQLIPVQSQEMHNEVVERALHLLHNQSQFAAAENAYQDALRELRNGYPNDAITDAASALQDALKALGCTGNSLGELLKSAKQTGLLQAADARFTSVLSQTIEWVKDTRNAGEAHSGVADYAMSDAWMIVHVVGALIIRLSEQKQAS